MGGSTTKREHGKLKSPLGFYEGDHVFVVYWHQFNTSPHAWGSSPRGKWDVIQGRVVSIGNLVCFETFCPHVAQGGTVPAVDGSTLRFTTADRVFTDQETAETNMRSREPLE